MSGKDSEVTDDGKNSSEIGWFRSFVDALIGSPGKLLVAGLLSLAVSNFFPDHRTIPSEDVWDNAYAAFGYFLHEITRDLGIAFLIAVAISVAIEQISAEKRNKEIRDQVEAVQDNALAAVFNTTLPAGWLQYVRNTLEGRNFYRSNMRVRYDIREPTPDEQKLCQTEFVVCTVSFSYRVTNTSPGDLEYEIRSYVELPWEPELQKIPHLETIAVNGDPVDENKLKTARYGSVSQGQLGKSYSYKVSIPGSSYRDVDIVLRQINYKRDTTTFTCIDPADSLHVRLVTPAGYHAYLRLKHPNAKDNGEGKYGRKLELYGDPHPADDEQHASDRVPKETLGNEDENSLKLNETWVSIKQPCFPCTSVELSWVDRVQC